MVPGAVQAALAGAAVAWRAIERDWPSLLQEELVKGTAEKFIGAMEAGLSQRSAQRSAPGLSEQVAARMRLALARAQYQFDASVSAGFIRITQRAAASNWTSARYEEAIRRFSMRAGESFKGSWIETWFRTFVLSGAHSQAVLDRFSAQPTARLYPYLIYKTVEDDLVRPAHAALNNFIARSTWPGWPTILPPIDWNCRCKVLPVGVLVARASGLDGDFPLSSDSKLIDWPGPGPSFPRRALPRAA